LCDVQAVAKANLAAMEEERRKDYFRKVKSAQDLNNKNQRLLSGAKVVPVKQYTYRERVGGDPKLKSKERREKVFGTDTDFTIKPLPSVEVQF